MNTSIGELEIVQPRDLPSSVAQEIWLRSDLYTDAPRLTPDEFKSLHRITFDNVTTYLAEQTKKYSANGDIESITHFVDVDESEAQIGYGELRFALTNDSPFFAGKPFVGWIFTEEPYQRTGLGTRRLTVMNAASMAIHGLPLHSSDVVSDAAADLCKKLAAQGLAIECAEGDTSNPEGRTRYVAATAN